MEANADSRPRVNPQNKSEKLPQRPLMAATTRAITPTLSGPFGAPNRPVTPGGMGPNQQSRNHTGATFGPHLTKSPSGLSPRHSPLPLTGAAALADERRERSRQTSPNPQTAVMQSLRGVMEQSSRPEDAPPDPTQMSAPLEQVAKALVMPDQNGAGGMRTSPESMISPPFNDMTTATTATAMEATAGPMQGHEGPGAPPQHHQQQQHQHIAPNLGENPVVKFGDSQGNRAFTFPGPQPLPQEHDMRQPQRQMSLPGYQNSPKSPGKRHKCPYCSTDFTRHHNLKSHLLTHSQEKPFECNTCNARFRRLHDLKRHGKLHTGERPHICDKCGRRFARGDALARHNKGQGGCAGRRASFEMNDDMDGKGEEGMDGVMYQHERDGEADEDEDGSGRRVSEPARKRQNTGNSTQGSYHQHSNTYPPIAASRGHNNLLPLYSQGSSGSSRDQMTNMSPKLAPSSMANMHYGAQNQSSVFQNNITESPKPLSPGHPDQQHRLGAHDGSIPGPRSPSMSQQIHHQNYNRRTGSRQSPSINSMPLAPPPPHGGGSGTHLPPIHGLNNAHPMVPMQAQGGRGNNPNMHQQGPDSQQNSMSSHGTGSVGSMRDVPSQGQSHQDPNLVALLRQFEEKQRRSDEEAANMRNQLFQMQQEVANLRSQLAQQQATSATTVASQMEAQGQQQQGNLQAEQQGLGQQGQHPDQVQGQVQQGHN